MTRRDGALAARSEGDDTLDAEIVESDAEQRSRTLGGKAPAPHIAGEAPADLDVRRGRQEIRRRPHADQPDEPPGHLLLRGEESHAVGLLGLDQPVDQHVRFLRG